MGRTARTRSAHLIGGFAMLASLAGCGVAVDFFNPAFIQGLGLNPNSLRPAQGTIIVNFNNRTNFPVVFNGLTGPDSADPANGGFEFSVPTDPNASGNEVLTCPARFVTLSRLGDDMAALDGVAAVVFADDGEVEVGYFGAILMNGGDYICGDVINVTLSPAAGGGEAADAFVITVERIPGS